MALEAGPGHHLFRRAFMCLFDVDDAHPAVQLLDLHLRKHPQILTWSAYALVWFMLNLLTALLVLYIITQFVAMALYLWWMFVVGVIKTMVKVQATNARIRNGEMGELKVTLEGTEPNGTVVKETVEINTGTHTDTDRDMVQKQKARWEGPRREEAQSISINPLFPKSK